MKKTLILAALAALVLTGCTDSTKYGKCIGILDKENPGLQYSVSTWNLVVDFLFSETVVVPVVGVLSEFKCPEGTIPAK